MQAVTPLSCQRVLIVDDRRDSSLILQTLLKRAGHEVATADSGADAIEVIPEFDPDVIVSDLTLGGTIDGLALARSVSGSLATPAVRLVAVTGHDDDEYRQHAREAGFHHYLVKPAGVEELLALVAQGRVAAGEG